MKTLFQVNLARTGVADGPITAGQTYVLSIVDANSISLTSIPMLVLAADVTATPNVVPFLKAKLAAITSRVAEPAVGLVNGDHINVALVLPVAKPTVAVPSLTVLGVAVAQYTPTVAIDAVDETVPVDTKQEDMLLGAVAGFAIGKVLGN